MDDATVELIRSQKGYKIFQIVLDYHVWNGLKPITDSSPNVSAEWLALLLYIKDVLGSNLSLKTGYPG
jgi:hypothetical protein